MLFLRVMGPVEVAHIGELKRQNQENQKLEASLVYPFKKLSVHIEDGSEIW